MKKQIYSSIAISFLLILFLNSYETMAQLSISPYASYTRLSANFFGVGGKGEFILSLGKKGHGGGKGRGGAKTVSYGNVMIAFGSQSGSDYAYAFSSTTTPQEVDITSKSKMTIFHIIFGEKRYFGGDYKDGGFYGFLEVGLMIIPVKTTYGSFDQSKYYTTGGGSDSFSNFIIGGGLGYEAKINKTQKFFGEAKINLPANQVNGQAVDVEIGVSIGLNVGMRFQLGK